MSRSPVPRMTHHKASGQAVVRLTGVDHYLGPWRSKAARIEYDRIIAEWLAHGRQGLTDASATVSEVLAGFWDFALAYYRRPDGTQTNEIRSYHDVLRVVRRLYGHTPAAEFGPLALKAARQAMVQAGLCRTYINRQVGRVKRIFKWAVENELVPPAVHQGLQAVAGLRAGRSEARESEPVKPVADDRVDAVIAVLSPSLAKLIRMQETCGHRIPDQDRLEMEKLAIAARSESPVAAMVQLQRLSGARPGEITAMRSCDVNTRGQLWVYQPGQHKTHHHGHSRAIYFGPRAQAILRPFLKHDLQAFIFSPAESMANYRCRRHADRKTPMSCGNVPGSNRKRRPRKTPTGRYDTNAYARAIVRACEVAFGMPVELRTTNSDRPKPTDAAEELAAKATRRREKERQRRLWHKASCWHPHQLRHAAATRLRRDFGLEAAQVILGHRTLTVTQVYAERNVAAAMQIMAKVG